MTTKTSSDYSFKHSHPTSVRQYIKNHSPISGHLAQPSKNHQI